MSPIWNRRRFLSNLALSAAASRRLFAAPRLATSSYLAFVGIASPDQLHHDCIEAYRVHNGCWSRIGAPALAEKPHALAVHPHLPVLYVAHHTSEHHHLPRGSVSAFRFRETSGELKLLGRQPLAFSATHPDTLTVSPNGRSLMVGASTGGAWNFFSLASNGAIHPTPAALKLTGSGPHPSQTAARPHTVVCDPSARYAYATDFGSDRIDQIVLPQVRTGHDCLSMPTFVNRIGMAAGSGPAHIALHSSGKMLIAVHQLRPALSAFEIDSAGNMSPRTAYFLPLDADRAGPMISSRNGDRLYLLSTKRSSATTLSVFGWSSANGRPSRIQDFNLPAGSTPTQMVAAEHELLLIGSQGIDRVGLHPATGSCYSRECVLTQLGVVSLAIHLL